MPKAGLKFSLHFKESDRDILDFLEELKKDYKASDFVRDAIREKMQGNGSPSGKIQDLERRILLLEGGMASRPAEKSTPPISPDLMERKSEAFQEELEDAVNFY